MSYISIYYKKISKYLTLKYKTLIGAMTIFSHQRRIAWLSYYFASPNAIKWCLDLFHFGRLTSVRNEIANYKSVKMYTYKLPSLLLLAKSSFSSFGYQNWTVQTHYMKEFCRYYLTYCYVYIVFLFPSMLLRQIVTTFFVFANVKKFHFTTS